MGIYIGSMSYDIDEQDLKNLFAQYGTVRSVRLTFDRFTSRSRGFAFIEMSDSNQKEAVISKEEQAAIEALNGTELMGRTVTVSYVKPEINRRGLPNIGRDRRE